jgi:hypothetical protein
VAGFAQGKVVSRSQDDFVTAVSAKNYVVAAMSDSNIASRTKEDRVVAVTSSDVVVPRSSKDQAGLVDHLTIHVQPDVIVTTMSIYHDPPNAIRVKALAEAVDADSITRLTNNNRIRLVAALNRQHAVDDLPAWKT